MISLAMYQVTDSQQITGQGERYLRVFIPLAISFTLDELDQRGNGSVIICTNMRLQHKPSFLLVIERKRGQQFLRRHRIWFPGIDNVRDFRCGDLCHHLRYDQESALNRKSSKTGYHG